MKKIRIGVVDDNRDFCDVVTDYLVKQSNMEIAFLAHDGMEAMEYLKRRKLSGYFGSRLNYAAFGRLWCS